MNPEEEKIGEYFPRIIFLCLFSDKNNGQQDFPVLLENTKSQGPLMNDKLFLAFYDNTFHSPLKISFHFGNILVFTDLVYTCIHSVNSSIITHLLLMSVLSCLTSAKSPSPGSQIFFLEFPVLFKGGIIVAKDAKFRA